MNQSVTVYYDETRVVGKNLNGHVLFFVPDQIENTSTQFDNAGYVPLFESAPYTYYPRHDLLQAISNVRGNGFQSHKFHFCDISGTKWDKYDAMTYKIINILIESLRSKGCQMFRPPLCCKVAVLYYPENKNINMYRGETKKEKKLRFDETMLRILLKGACHYLYDEEHTISISNFIVDGFPAHRNFDHSRIIEKLYAEERNNRTQLRDYVQFEPNIKITHIDSDLRNYAPGSAEFEHANFLQCADLLLGTITYSLFEPIWRGKKHFELKEPCQNKKVFLSKNMRTMLSKVSRENGFTNSGHYKAFSVSKVLLERGNIVFQDLDDIISHQNQQSHFTQPFEQIGFDFSVY